MTIHSVQSHAAPIHLAPGGGHDEACQSIDPFDPQQNPDIQTTLHNQAGLLCKAALLNPGAAIGGPDRTAALLRWADRLSQEAAPTSHDLRSLAKHMDQLPASLHRVAAHLGACAGAQEEWHRLKSAMSRATIDGSELADMQRYANGTLSLLDTAREKIAQKDWEALTDIAKTIQARNRNLAAALTHSGVLRHEHSPAGPQTTDPMPPSPRKTHAGAMLRGMFSQVAQVAHSFKSSRAALVHPKPPAPPHHVSAADRRTAAKDLSQLSLNVRAERLRSQLMGASQALFDLELKVSALASASDNESTRLWALNTRNVLLRNQRAKLDTACRGFKGNAAGCRKADAVILDVLKQMATVQSELVDKSIR